MTLFLGKKSFYCAAFWVIFAVIFTPNVSAQVVQLSYKVILNDQSTYNMTYTVKELTPTSPGTIQINTARTGRFIQELTTCYLNEDKQLISLTQHSVDEYAKDEYKWDLNTQGLYAYATYDSLRWSRKKQKHVALPKNGYPMQALFYVMQDWSLHELGQQKSFYFLIPNAQFFPMKAKVVSIQSVPDYDPPTKALRVEIKPEGLFSFFGGTRIFWLRLDPPHIPLRYEAPDMIAVLDS